MYPSRDIDMYSTDEDICLLLVVVGEAPRRASWSTTG
jgi:hypothetical protein